MNSKPRIINRPPSILFCVALLLSILCFPASAKANPFDAYIASKLSTLLSSGPQWQVKIEKLEGQFPFRLKADRITISAPQGVWAIAENVVFRWSPWAAIRLLIHIEEMSAETVQVMRAAMGEEQKPESSKPFKLPSMLRRMTIDQLAVERLVIEEEVAGQSAAFHLEGSLKATGAGSGRNITVYARRVGDGPEMHANLEGTFTYNEVQALKLNADLFEAPGGWVAAALDIGNAGALNLQIQGGGPLESWKGTLEGSAGKYGAVHTEIGMEVQREINLTLAGKYDPAAGLFLILHGLSVRRRALISRPRLTLPNLRQ